MERNVVLGYHINGTTFRLKKILQMVHQGGLNAVQLNSGDCWFQDASFLQQGKKRPPSKDASAELSTDNPELKRDITFCSILLSKDIAVMENTSSN